MSLLKTAYYILIAGIGVVALLLIFSTFPVVGDYKLMTVLSGSMAPAIKLGSVVVVKPTVEYGVGDMVTFGNPEAPDKTTTHRIFEIKKEGEKESYITKGDANDAPDTGEVLRENVVGKVRLTIPYLGYAVDFAKKPAGFVLLIIIPATMIIYGEVMKIKEEVTKAWRERKEKAGGSEPPKP